jgi:AcrR family transcriptional regulator
MDRILSIASELIGQHGSDQLKMSDVAARAEISIGSLYQYFPDKASIIRRLAERYTEESRRYLQQALEGVASADELKRAYVELLDQYYALFLAEPVIRDIWSGMQADKELMALELQESRVCSTMLADAMNRVFQPADPQKMASTAFLIWQLGEAAMRLAISVGRQEGDAIIEAFKHMTVREILQPIGRQ